MSTDDGGRAPSPRPGPGNAAHMNQTSFDFSAPPEPPTPAPPPTAAADAPRPDKQPPSDGSPAALEAMARQLEQHPDYRVLRRLVPVHDFGPRPAAMGGAGEMGEAGATAHRVIVLDTETTGLSHQADKIIELAMLMVQVDAVSGLPFGLVELYEGFEDPGMPIPPVAREVTGITDEMVRGQQLDEAAVAQMLAQADLVIAHNAGFDRPFVEARFPDFAGKAWACSFKDIDWKAAGAESLKLSALAADQGWFYDAHRAQVDCHALLQVLARPLAADGQTGLARLITAASQPSFKLSATGSPFESKDVLKARGYRWDAEAKVWNCLLSDDAALQAELVWLTEAVYRGRAASVDLERLDGHVRYSVRHGEKEKRRL